MLHAMQFSLFGAEAATPTLEDLVGVLFAGGHWVRRGSPAGAARLSVLVDDPWRQDALLAELDARGLPGEAVVEDGSHGVRTGFEPVLGAMAARWIRGASMAAPADVRLTPSGLRLWAICGGRHDEAGYLLRTASLDDPVHRVAGSHLARLGLAGVSIGERGGPGWRITGAKRRHRLAELIGAPPRGSGADWPS